MTEQITNWLFVSLLVWFLLKHITTLLHILWQIFLEVFDKQFINLSTKFGEWAVVTGSTDGIGKAYAKELAVRHMNLILISRNLEKLEKTKEEILAVNPNVKVKLVVADFSEGKEAIDKIRPHLENVPIGILVNNVGLMYEYPTYFGEISEKRLWDIITVNVGATTLMTRLVIKQMQEQKQGAIINVSSASEYQPTALMTVYAATKTYMKNFSDAIRMEYSQFGITVQHLAPFFITTKMTAFSHRLQISGIFVPDATTYARHAITTLGKLDNNTGYWPHSVQKFLTFTIPMWIRLKLGFYLNKNFRREYFKRKAEQKLQ